MKKKVMLLGNHGFVIYNFRKELIKELLRNGYEVYISLPYDNEKVEKMVSWGCKFIETNVDGRSTNPIKDIKLLSHYINILKEIKPDVVLAYTIKPNIYGGIACRLLGIPCINTVTGLGSGFKDGSLLKPILSFMYKVALKKSRSVFFQNTEDLGLMRSINALNGEYMLIPGSGVNLDEFKYKEITFNDNTDVNFIFIGRIMKDKGIDQYLEAAEIIKEKYPNSNFDIIGYVEKSQPQYKEKIDYYASKSIVSYRGYQSNVRPYVEKAHCLIQPSHGGEGISNVLLEAAAIGRPLIASNIPGCRETIRDGENGFLFEPKDTSELVKNIERFLRLSNQEKINYGRFSRKLVEKEFNRNNVVKAYFEVIKTTM